MSSIFVVEVLAPKAPEMASFASSNVAMAASSSPSSRRFDAFVNSALPGVASSSSSSSAEGSEGQLNSHTLDCSTFVIISRSFTFRSWISRRLRREETPLTAAPISATVSKRTKTGQFARANWPVFVLFETVALIGAAVSGVSSRRKRLEIQDLNVKLREMMTKVEQSKVCEFNWPSEPSADDDDDDDATPGSALLTKASNLLELGELDAAIATFDEAKLAISGAFGANTSTTKMDDKGAHSSHWSPYDRVGVVNADP